MIIHQTTNYSLFGKYISNRNVQENNLVASIQKKNMLSTNPIIVKTNPKKENHFFIIDGQNRHAAARKLGVPIFYIIADHLEESDIPSLQVQRPWTMGDFLNFYCVMERQDYLFIQTSAKKYNININLLVEICYHEPTKAFKAFRAGEFLIKQDKNILEKKLEKFSCAKPAIDRIRESPCTKYGQLAIWRLINHPDYDHNHFLDKLDRYRDMIIDSFKYNTCTLIYDKLITTVYNRNNKDKKKTS